MDRPGKPAAARFIPFGVRAAAVYADSFSKQRLDGRVCQKVKLSLYAFPFMCLSVLLLLCLSVAFCVYGRDGEVNQFSLLGMVAMNSVFPFVM